MTKINARGLVLREYEAGEADKRLLLLCKERGRVMVYARGARKPRSKFMAAAQLFTYADFVLVQGRDFFSLAEATVIESFYDLRTDYDRLAAAHAIVQVCDKTLWEDSNCDRLLKLVLKSLLNLAKGHEPQLVQSVFMFRFFDFYGLKPTTNACANCGETAAHYWGAEGLLCRAHAGNSSSISNDCVQAISHILDSELAQAFLFSASPGVLSELEQAAKIVWDYHFGGQPWMHSGL